MIDYDNDFDEIMLRKIDSGEELTEDELKELTEYEIEQEKGENRRWTRTITSIVELFGRFFALEWEEALTEMQENEFYSQPYEVEKVTYEKTITVTEWKPLKKEDKEIN